MSREIKAKLARLRAELAKAKEVGNGSIVAELVQEIKVADEQLRAAQRGEHRETEKAVEPPAAQIAEEFDEVPVDLPHDAEVVAAETVAVEIDDDDDDDLADDFDADFDDDDDENEIAVDSVE